MGDRFEQSSTVARLRLARAIATTSVGSTAAAANIGAHLQFNACEPEPPRAAQTD